MTLSMHGKLSEDMIDLLKVFLVSFLKQKPSLSTEKQNMEESCLEHYILEKIVTYDIFSLPYWSFIDKS